MEKLNMLMNEIKLKKGLANKVIDEIVDIAKKEAELRNVKSEDTEKFLCARVRTLVRKKANVITLKVIPIFSFGENDYGATKKYNDRKAIWASMSDEDKTSAVLKKEYSTQGEPLWTSALTKADFKVGQQIKPVEEKEQVILMLAKNEQEINFKKAFLTIRGEKVISNIPYGCECDFEAVLGQKSDNEQYFLLPTDKIVFNNPVRKEIKQIIISNFKDCIIDSKELRKFAEENATNARRFCFVKGNISRMQPRSINSTIIELDFPEADFSSDEASIACFMIKEANINFNEDAQDVIIVGRPFIGKDDKIGISGFNAFAPEDYVIKEQPKPITKENNVMGEDW